jgi:hypothetical protein
VTPARILAERLADARREGATFARAWPTALSAALAAVEDKSERARWQDVCSELVDVWRSAFAREAPDVPAQAAFTRLADPERCVPVPERECRHCGGEIPAALGRKAVFCGDECVRAAKRARERLREAA